MSNAHALNAHTFPLRGSHLIEASAGTGKTWTIAALYVRLVLGHGHDGTAPVRPMLPQDVLVMTFTRAATRELSDRIRARLTEAAQVFRGMAETDDDFLQQLKDEYPDGEPREQAAHRLSLAAQAMDDAAVYTIDAWCQRMLREHAFDSGSLFEENLVGDEAALRLEAVQDYWRQQLYPMGTALVTQVLGVWRDVPALEQDMRALMAVPLADAEPGTLAQVFGAALTEREAQLRALKQGWNEKADKLLDWINGQMAKPNHGWIGQRLNVNHRTLWLTTLKNWALSDADGNVLKQKMQTGWDRFTPEGLLSCRALGSDQIEFPSESQDFADLKKALQALPEPAQVARLHARTHVLQRMAELKRRSGLFGFADMLQRLDVALADPESGDRLAQRLREQFPVAMIDEFQDTSPLQFRIFDRIYRTADNRPDIALLLIGDPKQSIYGFRGADIHSYLAARRATAGRHHVLGTNFRSTSEVVEVVNRWFDMASDAFGYKQGDEDPLPFQPVGAKGRDEIFRTSAGDVQAMTVVHDATLRSTRDAQTHLSALCAEQIVAWLSDPQARFVDPDKGEKPLQPKDIAVLVRTGKEAAAVRDALRLRGVASVYLSDRDSVFASDEAQDLCLWLRGVAEPQDMRRLRAALGTRTVGLSLAELYDLATHDELLDTRAEQMRELHKTWQSQGVLAMLRQSLHVLQLAGRWRGQADGERRLTNVLHLAELLQAASGQIDGEQALIRWLAQQMDEAQSGNASGGEAQTVRLESDEDLVKVITIHASKGLEYPVVCLPFAHSHRVVTADKAAVLQLEGGEGEGADEGAGDGKRHWTLDFDKEDSKLADHDRLREDLRLWYVALTRARHALWVGWSAVKRGNGKTCVNHTCAAGHLLSSGQELAAADWLNKLQALQTSSLGQPLSVHLKVAPADVPLTLWHKPAHTTELREALSCTARIDKSWTIASFSRLTRDLSAQTLAPLVLHLNPPRPADDEPPEDAPLPTAWAASPGALAPWHGFAKGPTAGNFLHDQLEWLAADGFVLDLAKAERLKYRCENAGYKAQADDVLQWLSRLVAKPLRGPNAPLNALGDLLPEMEFWLPAERLHARQVDALCQQHLLPGVSRPQLPDAQLHGMLMGFADLVFEHEGRYWVLDYKSNYLGGDDAAYTAQALDAAMAQHRYEVQAALYLLALHRLLRARLGDAYDPAQQLGGAVYLFLRGIDGPAGGCCTLPVPLALIDGLDNMLKEGVA
ncbi:exodeoxyribonuclease V subunit beta [Limnohabitans sp. Rim28]|uniref:exodeoxyribonuclease V subunit beta n=1 Tax=Limnohabitans sp. Rim28 TaxID=1100720 RepID=UPI0002ED4513|nr:exodeoxyribonuclease V subunit beta [Limnohabitans sp. Rim28]PVE05536.1 exodeoxyribonuclease V subunit beta [Limnohabitans sp. Rim28]